MKPFFNFLKSLFCIRIVFLVVLFPYTVFLHCVDGSLDLTFDSDGKQVVDFGGEDTLEAVVLQSDGKIIAVGRTDSGSGTDWAITRLNVDGSIDITFDSDGKVTTNIGSAEDIAKDVAIQSDGKLVVVGNGPISGATANFVVARYNTDGSLDTGFGTGGLVSTNVSGSGDNNAFSVVIQPDGKIIVVGGAVFDLAVVRYNTDGSLDNTFGTGGIVTTDVSGTGETDSGQAVLVQSDGKIVVAATTSVNFYPAFGIVRYNSDGSLDTTFGTGGITITKITPSRSDRVTSAAFQSDGKIIVAGDTSPGFGQEDYVLARYTQAGILDATFGVSGITVTDISSYDDVGKIAVQDDDKIIFVGGSAADNNYTVMRFTATGSLDSTFGSNGVISTDISGSLDIAQDVVIQSDNKVIVAGYSGTGEPARDFSFARYVTGQETTDQEITTTVVWGYLDISLNRNVTLKDLAITFSGVSTIDGRGNCLILDGSSRIEIAPSSTLFLKNLTVKNVFDENIRCLENDSLLKLQNVAFFLSGDYFFNTGSFQVEEDFEIHGVGKCFSYTSNMISFLDPLGSIVLNKDVTFYCGSSVENQTQGLRLTKENLCRDKNSFIRSRASVKTENVILSNDVNTRNNRTVYGASIGILEIDRGFIVQEDA